ncbi:hypothetical protein SAMN02746065_1468 [Desulfocicer vacuolatum DSM 3385]|uniref:Uncharacterized protein n=1 Tax=Desulfocicer vacuolatum DSM 3385 TaxID=1121400 RepID=A0A1W2ETU5_9BACT|nr:hypothetical protein SAMN02746065_1468 [Desulfocicer vacuolatum DSM 3385]
MFWYRLEASLGRNSLLGTTIKSAALLPRHLSADGKHTRLLHIFIGIRDRSRKKYKENFLDVAIRLWDCFKAESKGAWLHTLRRRSQKGRSFTWERFEKLIRWLIPRVRLIHPFPNLRFQRYYPR